MPVAVLFIASTMLFIGVAPMPYGYYMLLRLVATSVFAWAAFVSYGRNQRVLPWVFALFALLFNPFLPIHLPKELWMVVDICAGLLLLFAIPRIRQPKLE